MADDASKSVDDKRMIQLRLLGGFELATGRDAGDGGIAGQPKRAALLLYLAAARPNGFQRRDVLLAMVWPEADTEHARQGLRQLVLQLRKVLGTAAIEGRGKADLRVNPELVAVDSRQFEACLLEGRTAEALQLYRGDFVTGFHLPGASSDWEEWVEQERGRLRSLATGAAWTMAQREERAGNSAGATYWAWRAVELAPDEETGMRSLLALLLRLGDHSGASRAGTDYIRRQRDVFGAEASPAVLKLVAQARQAIDDGPRPVAPDPPPPSLPAIATASPNALTDTPPSLTTSRRWRWAVSLSAAVGLITAWQIFRPAPAAPRETFAVGYLQELSGGDSAIPTPVLRDLLSTSLARLPGVSVISTVRLLELEAQLGAGVSPDSRPLEAAKLAGASTLLGGRIQRDEAGYTLQLTATGMRRGIIQFTIEASAADLYSLADEATASVSRQLHLDAPLPSIRDFSTHSLLAYRLYEEGLRAFSESDYRAAGRLFRSAIEADSTFAMPWYYASLVADVNGDGPAADSLIDRVVALANRVPDRERLLIRARWAERNLDPATLAYAETLAVRYPAEPDGPLILGGARLTFGDPETAIEPLLRVIRMDSLGLRGQVARCRACVAYRQVILTNVYLNRFSEAQATLARWRRAQPGAADPKLTAGMIASFLDQPSGDSAVDRVLDSAALAEPTIEWALSIRRGEFDRLNARAQDLLKRGTPGRQADARWWLDISLRTQGRLREALASAEGIGAARDELQSAQILCESGRGTEGARVFRRIAGQSPGSPASFHAAKHHSWYLTHTATCLALTGDTAALGPLADTVQRVGASSSWRRHQRLHHYIRGLIEQARGNSAAAVEEFRQATTVPTEGFTRNNYELAGALMRLGRNAEAIEPLQAGLRGPLEAGGLYVTRTEIEERLAQAFDAMGQRDSALAHFRWVVGAWRQADPQFTSRWMQAEARVAALGAPKRD